VVHGGEQFTVPIRIDAAILDQLEKLSPLAPLHQPHNLAAIRAIERITPHLAQIACFDTAFHRTQPCLEQQYALPRGLTMSGVKRYGFHGLSYEYIAGVLPGIVGDVAQGRVVVAHLGNGSSMCAMVGGRSVASTMGFTAIDGLPMGTRCGSLDPGVIFFLLDQRKMDVRAVEKMLYSESGLLGVSGISSDVRTLLESKEPAAKLALDLYVYRIGRELGSLAAALGGLDTLVFTAGIGENDVALRERVCRDAAWLGVELDPAANAQGGPRITTKASRVTAWIIPTDEELMIARHTMGALGAKHTTESAYANTPDFFSGSPDFPSADEALSVRPLARHRLRFALVARRRPGHSL
jgi:acetate kinase